MTPISITNIISFESTAALRIHPHIVHMVLWILLDSPEFDFPLYIPQVDPTFASPPPINHLPAGHENITKQFVLRTLHIDESTYKGTHNLIVEFLRQLKLFSKEELECLRKLAAHPMIGDQLTIDHLHGSANYWCEDVNGYEHLDWLFFVFGWFHLMMAFANSLHCQYFGSAAGKGLWQAFSLLNRKGLQSVQIKGTFYHHLHKGIFHITEVHIRDCWQQVGGVEKLADLRNRSPAELKQLTERLVDKFASNGHVEDLEHLEKGQEDNLL